MLTKNTQPTSAEKLEEAAFWGLRGSWVSKREENLEGGELEASAKVSTTASINNALSANSIHTGCIHDWGQYRGLARRRELQMGPQAC